MNGNIEGLGFDTLNLYIMPKMGEHLTARLTATAEKFESPALKASAPILGRYLFMIRTTPDVQY